MRNDVQQTFSRDTAPVDPASVKGWGIDADPENDPVYPIKKRTNGEHEGYSWKRPARQSAEIEVLHSNERPDLTAVFGTSTPPSGLSGMLRRFAFGYSESSYGHWLPLMLADRINSVEGVLHDLASGRVPNMIAERGLKADWQHNRGALVRRTVTGIVLVSAAVALARSRTRQRSVLKRYYR